jgi:hypothetical protein
VKRPAIIAASLGLVLLTGCGVSSYAHDATVTSSPAYAQNLPSTNHTLTTCYVVNYPQPNLTALDNAEADNFNGPGQSALLNASVDDQAPAYQVTIINHNAAPVSVIEIDSVLFQGTSELTSDSQSIGQLISPGASLTFTFHVPASLVSSQTDDWGNPADYSTDANNCAVEQISGTSQ